MDNNNYSKTNQNIDPELRELLEVLESWSEFRPYFDPDFKILVLEESAIPIMIMNRKVFMELERKIVGEV
jgi:hypothetical protein